MPTWSATADVQARMPGRPIDATSQPTDTQVGEWLDDAEATLRATLRAIGLPDAVQGGSDAERLLKTWAVDYGEGRARMAWAANTGDGDNDDGKDIVERFNARIEDMLAKPTKYGELLTSSGAAPQKTRRLRSLFLDPDARPAAVFTREDEF